MSFSMEKQIIQPRFMSSVVTKFYQDEKLKNSCDQYQNKILSKLPISEIDDSITSAQPSQLATSFHYLSLIPLQTQNIPNIEPSTLPVPQSIQQLLCQINQKDKTISQLTLTIQQKTQQIQRERNNSFLTSKLHEKQIAEYEERIGEYERRMVEKGVKLETQKLQDECKKLNEQLLAIKQLLKQKDLNIVNREKSCEQELEWWREMVKLREQELQKRQSQVKTLQQRIRRLQEKLLDSHQRNSTIEKQRDELKSKLDESECIIDNFDSYINEIRQSTQSQAIQSLRQALDGKDYQLAKLKQRLSQQLASHSLKGKQLNSTYQSLEIQALQMQLSRSRQENAMRIKENKILHEQMQALQNTTLYLKKQVTSGLENYQKSLRQIMQLKQQSFEQRRFNRQLTHQAHLNTQRVAYTDRSTRYTDCDNNREGNSLSRRQNSSINSPRSHNSRNISGERYRKLTQQQQQHQHPRIISNSEFIAISDNYRKPPRPRKLDGKFIQNMNLSAMSLDMEMNKTVNGVERGRDEGSNWKMGVNQHKRVQTKTIVESIYQEECAEHQPGNKSKASLKGALFQRNISTEEDKELDFLQQGEMAKTKDTFSYDNDQILQLW